MSTTTIASPFCERASLQREDAEVENASPFNTDTPCFQDRMAHLAAPALPSYAQHGPESRTPIFPAFLAVMQSRSTLTCSPVLAGLPLFALHYLSIILYPFHAFW